MHLGMTSAYKSSILQNLADMLYQVPQPASSLVPGLPASFLVPNLLVFFLS